MVERDFHDSLDAEPVDVSHCEVLDTQVLQGVAVRRKESLMSRGGCLEEYFKNRWNYVDSCIFEFTFRSFSRHSYPDQQLSGYLCVLRRPVRILTTLANQKEQK